MKNLIAFLISCLSMTAMLAQVENTCRVDVLSKAKDETLLRFTLQGLDFQKVATPRGEAVLPVFVGGTPLLQAGSPDVPKWAGALMIAETGSTSVEVVSAEYKDFPNVEVAPSKGNLKRNVDPATVPYNYGVAYEREGFFPGKLAALQQPFVLREARGQAVWLFPVQYNAQTKVLRVYEKIVVRVFSDGGAEGENELRAPANLSASRTFTDIYEQAFLNFDKRFLARGGGAEIEKMLVIAQDKLIPELEPLLEWKRQTGISVELLPTSELGSGQAADVYKVVKDRYLSNGISYLLIVGDETAVYPEMRQDGDFYSCDNCFGYMDGDDHLPEVLVGRLHARDAGDLKIMVNRLLEYEKTPLVDADNNWCATGMASTSDQGAGFGDDGQADYEHGNEWKTKHLADGFEQYWEFYDGDQTGISPTPGDPTADKPGNPVSADLLDAMNGRGVSLYNYTGHGWEQGLVSGNFDVNAANAMTNAGRYPVIIAVACCAGHFTYSGGDCLGEVVQRAGDRISAQPFGAIAGFFSSDFQSWSPPMEGQDGMNQYLVDADGITLRPSIGGMAAIGNAKMIAAYAGDGELMADFWNPFADPTTLPRTALPKPIAGQHLSSVFIGTNSLSVTCDVEGALVCAYWQGQPIGVALVENGVASLIFSPVEGVGEMTVTITQFNHIPYQGKVSVVPSAGPFVVSQSILLDDASGDNDQKADFGEKINLDVTLANVGLDWAQATSLTLSVDDPTALTIVDGDEIFGDIEDSTSVARTAAFSFLVKNNVPDGKTVMLKFDLKFSVSMGYEILLPLKLQAPALAVGGLKIDDAGGNNNGRLDAGETAILKIENLNNGKSDSPAAVGKLTSSSPWLTVAPSFNLGSLAASGGTAEAQFVVQVSPDAPVSSPVSFDYQVVAGAYDAEKTFGGLIVNAIVEDFETHVFSTFPWQMSGNKPWIITPLTPYEGQYCARSGAITHSQNSVMTMKLTVTEDGFVSFARRVSSEQDYDFLHFSVDGNLQESWSGVQPWAEFSYPISAGFHELTWTYEKDGFSSDGQDKAWVDAIILPPHEIFVGADDLKTADFGMAVLPNPTGGEAFLNFNLTENQQVSIEILDITGRRIRTALTSTSMSAGSWTQRLDLEGLRSGVYLVELRGEHGFGVRKVVKE